MPQKRPRRRTTRRADQRLTPLAKVYSHRAGRDYATLEKYADADLKSGFTPVVLPRNASEEDLEKYEELIVYQKWKFRGEMQPPSSMMMC